MRAVDLAGRTFGRLAVLGRAPPERIVSNPKKAAWWRCHCACGTERVFRGDNLRSGSTVSCGCQRAEASSARLRARRASAAR